MSIKAETGSNVVAVAWSIAICIILTSLIVSVFACICKSETNRSAVYEKRQRASGAGCGK